MRQPVPFGKYLLLDRVSVGGMAEVFRAKSYGVEGFEKIIAIKRILPAMGEDKDFIKMFIDEAKIAGQLSHANICQIFELGKIQGSHFIAMEYIWGKDLLQIQNRLRKLGEAMPVAMACYVISKVCEGLDYAHRKKDAMGRPLEIIHRDCSPQNVLVSYEGEVKIIDFGIARAASRSSRTNAGVLKGKFGYMSPEQVRGLPLDHRSDLFAIGTCFYESLTGERLFQGESDFSTLEKVRNADVRPPSQLNQNIPPEVEGMVMRALTRDPKSRFESGAEMHAELQAFLTRQSVPFTSKTLADWVKRAFREDLEREKQHMENYKRIGRDGLIAGVPQARAKMDIVAELGQPPPIEGDPTALGGPSFEDMGQDELDAWLSTSLPANAQLPGAQAVGARAAPHGGARGKVVRSGTEGDWEPEEAPTEVFGEIGMLTPPGMDAAPGDGAAPSPSVLSSALPPGRAGNGAGHPPAAAPSAPPRAGRGMGGPPVGAVPPVRPPDDRGPRQPGPNGPGAMPPPGAAQGGPGWPPAPGHRRDGPPHAAPRGQAPPGGPPLDQPSEGLTRERPGEPRRGSMPGGSHQPPGGPVRGGAYPGMPQPLGGPAHASGPQGGPHAFDPNRAGPVPGPPPLGPGPMPGGAPPPGARGHRPLPGVVPAAAPQGMAPQGPPYGPPPHGPPHGPPPHGPPNHGPPRGGPGVAYPQAPPPQPDGPRMLGQPGAPGFVPPGAGHDPRRGGGPPDHPASGPPPGPHASVPLAGAYQPHDPSAANRQTILGGRPPSMPPPPAGEGSLPAFYPVLQPGRPLYPEAGTPHSPYPPPPSARPRTSPSPQRTTRGLLRRGNATRDIAIGCAIVTLLVGGILSAKFLLFGDEPEAAAVVPPTGTILVSVRDSQPAEVSVDGKLAGAIRDKTPLTLSALPPGAHTVVVTRAGARACERKVELGSRQVQVVECDFPKPPEFGRLILEGIGPGHRVFVDDQEVSVEAAREPLPLTPGVEHAIQVKSSAAGSPVVDEFTIELEANQELRRPLKGTGKPGARDKDRDSSRSRGARESRTQAEPEDSSDDELDDLDDDEPPARARAPAAGAVSAAVSSNQPGSFTAFTQPFARVYVDGKDTGKMTPIAPRSAISLPPGKHDITFVVGEQRFNYTITIAPGQNKNLVRTLPVK